MSESNFLCTHCGCYVCRCPNPDEDDSDKGIDPDYDPTPWCSGCGAMKPSQCDCGPIADNN
jgi:hypothetical protein